MIIKDDNYFILNTKNTTYSFRIMPTGHLEHLYYGRKIKITKSTTNKNPIFHSPFSYTSFSSTISFTPLMARITTTLPTGISLSAFTLLALHS